MTAYLDLLKMQRSQDERDGQELGRVPDAKLAAVGMISPLPGQFG